MKKKQEIEILYKLVNAQEQQLKEKERFISFLEGANNELIQELKNLRDSKVATIEEFDTSSVDINEMVNVDLSPLKEWDTSSCNIAEMFKNAGKRYRLLLDGEEIKEGDEFLSQIDVNWKPIKKSSIGSTFLCKRDMPIRRVRE